MAADSDTEKLAEIYRKLAADFPDEAYISDNSRGFALTGIKGQYIIERLNDVLGLSAWEFEPVKYELINTEMVCFGRMNVYFDLGTSVRTKTIYAVGSMDVIRDGHGDAYKGSQTDSICKCASQMGVGNAAYKGKIKTAVKPQKEVKSYGVTK